MLHTRSEKQFRIVIDFSKGDMLLHLHLLFPPKVTTLYHITSVLPKYLAWLCELHGC